MSQSGMRWALCVLVLGVVGVHACNEYVCASIVSKCMLTQACNCDLSRHPGNNCTCCADCVKCLDYLYQICCSCLGMCEQGEDEGFILESQVGDFPDPFSNLFKALTEDKEPSMQWSSLTFPIDVTLTREDSDLERVRYKLVEDSGSTSPSEQVTVNCTVVYLPQCQNGEKCRKNCRSMGAAAYRWFYDGCCECVGDNCINYGVNESRCLQCPLTEEEEFDDHLTDQLLSGSAQPLHDETALQRDPTV